MALLANFNHSAATGSHVHADASTRPEGELAFEVTQSCSATATGTPLAPLGGCPPWGLNRNDAERLARKLYGSGSSAVYLCWSEACGAIVAGQMGCKTPFWRCIVAGQAMFRVGGGLVAPGHAVRACHRQQHSASKLLGELQTPYGRGALVQI